MTSFEIKLLHSQPAVPVRLPDADPHCVTHDELLSFVAFRTWLSTLQKSIAQQFQTRHPFHSSPYSIRAISIQHVDHFGGGRLGFMKLSAEVSNDDGERLPGSVFLRGGSVAMLVILQPDDIKEGTEQDKHVILAVQPRIAAGSLSMVELPAGMIDDSGTFSGAAAKELKEEADLDITSDELIDMTALALPKTEDTTGESLQTATYPSPGGSDEFIPLFLCQKRVKRESLNQWTGKLTGLREHGEKITLKLVRLEDLWREGGRDGKTLCAWAMYEGLRKENKL